MASLVKSVCYASEPDGTQCRCGAPLKYIHCPGCGSTNFYAKGTASITAPMDGVDVTFQGFRCRRCFLDFFDGQTCEAPFFESENVKKRREKEAAYNKVEEAKQACYKECKERGMTQKEAERVWMMQILKIKLSTDKEPGQRF